MWNMLDCDGSQNRRSDVNEYLGSVYIMLGSVGARGLLATWVTRRTKSLFPTVSLAMCGRPLAWNSCLKESAYLPHLTLMLRPSKFVVCCKLRGRFSADIKLAEKHFHFLLPHRNIKVFIVGKMKII